MIGEVQEKVSRLVDVKNCGYGEILNQCSFQSFELLGKMRFCDSNESIALKSRVQGEP